MVMRRILYRSVALVLIAVFFLCLRNESVADMTVTKVVTTTVGEEKSIFTQKIYWTKSKLRTNDPAGRIMITDLNAKTITVLMPKEKQYLQDSFEDMKKREAALPAEIREAKLSVKETGEKRTIDGYPCEKLAMKAGPTEIEVWGTKKIAIDPVVGEFNKKFLELTKGINTLNLQGQMNEAFQERSAYPYLTIIEIPLTLVGKTQRMESKVKNVSYEKIKASVFLIPSGYKRIAVPEVPPQE